MEKYKTLHPALDMKDNILVIGFNKKTFIQEDKKFKKENHYLVVEQSNDLSLNTHIINENTFKSNLGQNYAFDSNSEGKQRRLIDLDSRWSFDKLKAFENQIKWNNVNRKSDNIGLFNQLENQLRAYVLLEKDEDYKIIVSWILMTYFFPIFPAIPYLWFKAPKGSGKTTILTFTKLTTFNANKSNATIPAMRDIIDNTRGTFIIDQADNKLGSKSDNDMKDIITDSYKASSGKVSKQVVINKDFQPVEFDAYCPKVFASIKDLHPDLSDRCIQIPMFKSLENLNYLDDNSVIWLELRDKIYRFLINNYGTAKDIYNNLFVEYQDSRDLVGRPLELWLPLEVIMTICDLEKETVNRVKDRFKNQFSNVEFFISATEEEVIKILLNRFGQMDVIEISNKEIKNAIGFSDNTEDPDYHPNGDIYIGHIVKRLNLATRKGHGRNGNNYTIHKDRILMIAKGYNIEIPEHLTEKIIEVDNNIPKDIAF